MKFIFNSLTNDMHNPQTNNQYIIKMQIHVTIQCYYRDGHKINCRNFNHLVILLKAIINSTGSPKNRRLKTIRGLLTGIIERIKGLAQS